MPSKSQAQHNLMEAVAHNPKVAKKTGIVQGVAKEFVEADAGQSVKRVPKKAKGKK